MYKLQLIAGLCLIIVTLASCCRLVCYYDSVATHREWDGRFTIADIDPNKCTHLVYAFSDINDKHELVPSCEVDRQSYWHFNDLKTRNPMLKTLLAVGGPDVDQRKFSSMVSTQENRAKFIQSAINLLRPHGFDGINLDWRNPRDTGCQQKEEKLKFTLLIKEMKEAFEAVGIKCDRLIVTATVSAERKTINASYDVPELAKHLDFINVLTFDFHGPWESVTGHHSPLYRRSQDTGDHIYSNVDSAMQYWVDQGAPPQKLNMGFAAYGRAFTLSSTYSCVAAPASGPGEEGCYTGEEGFWAFYEICLYLEDVAIQMIPDQKVPYATTENQWVGYDNAASLDTKVQYLKANKFGGAFVWSLDLDDFHGRFCKQGNYPFISHLRTLLVSGCSCVETHPPATTTTTTTTPTTTSTTPMAKCNKHTTTSTTPTTTFTTPTTIPTAPTTKCNKHTTTSTIPTTTFTTPTTSATLTTTSTPPIATSTTSITNCNKHNTTSTTPTTASTTATTTSATPTTTSATATTMSTTPIPPSTTSTTNSTTPTTPSTTPTITSTTSITT